LGTGMFQATGAKTVTVRVPSDATEWNGKTGTFSDSENSTDGPHWGEGFRGKGWTGSAYSTGGSVKTNITLTIVEDD
jgi:hypothetical protein